MVLPENKCSRSLVGLDCRAKLFHVGILVVLIVETWLQVSVAQTVTSPFPQ